MGARPPSPTGQPLRDVPEKEVALYAHLKDLPAHITECPHSSEAYRGEIQQLLLKLEENHPGTRHSIMAGYEELAADRRDLPRRERVTDYGECDAAAHRRRGTSAGVLCWTRWKRSTRVSDIPTSRIDSDSIVPTRRSRRRVRKKSGRRYLFVRMTSRPLFFSRWSGRRRSRCSRSCDRRCSLPLFGAGLSKLSTLSDASRTCRRRLHWML